MKKFLITLVIILIAGIVEARPAFTNGQYYVWSSATVASNALQYINVDSQIFPFVQKHTKNTLENWVPEVLIRNDGKYCFPRIPESLLDKMGIPEGTRELFFTAFNPTIEIYQDNWFETE